MPASKLVVAMLPEQMQANLNAGARRTDMHPLVAGILIWAVVAALFIGFMVGAGEQERRRK